MSENVARRPRHTDQLFHDAFKASPIGIAIESMEGQPIFANHALCKMLGLSEEEMRRKRCVEFSPPEDASKDWALFEKLRAGLISHYQLEKRFFRRDGSLIWGQLRVSLLNSRPSPLVVAMVEDVTEKRRAQENLELVTKGLAAAVCHCSRDLKFLWVNQRYADLVCRPLPEIIGMPISQVLGESAFESLRPHFERVLAGEDVHYERKTNFEGQGDQWISAAYTPTLDANGIPNGWVAVIFDTTKQKRVEETLRESEEKFRSIFRDAGVGMVVVSPDGRFIGANGTFCDYLGYKEEELLGKTVQSITLADDWPAFSQRISKALTEGHSFQRFQKRCLHKTGRVVHTESSASLIRSSAGAPLYFVGEVLDVTKRREAEEALSTINRRLIEAQEQERTRIGRDLHDDICQRLALLECELDRIGQQTDVLPAEILDQLRMVQRRTAEISADVQAMSHALHTPKLEHLGIVVAMRSICDEFGRHQRADVDFKSYDLAGPVPSEISLCLIRVLQEALHNAAKHSGVSQVKAVLRGDRDEVLLTISDAGRGFDLDSATKGLGLGLTSMRERVRLVNGAIQIQSGPMAGTTIEVRIPVPVEQVSQRIAS